MVIFPPLGILLVAKFAVFREIVTVFSGSPALRLARVRVTELTMPPIVPELTPDDGSSSLVATIMPAVSPLLGAPMVTPARVTVMVVAARIGVPPKVMTMDDAPNADKLVNE